MSFEKVGRALLSVEDQANFGFPERTWYGKIKPSLTFPTSKMLVIADWRLALLNRALQLGVLVYVLFNLISEQAFLLLEVPTNVMTMYSSFGNLTRKQDEVWAQLQTQDAEASPAYCISGSKYDYVWDEDWQYWHHGCKAALPGSSARKGVSSSSYFFITMEQTTRYFIAEKQPERSCSALFASLTGSLGGNRTCSERGRPGAQDEIKGNWLGILDDNGTVSCSCTQNAGYFHLAVEEMMLHMDHFVKSSAYIENDALVKTIVRVHGSAENKKVFEAGSRVNMTVQDLLDWGEVELDKRADEGLNRQWLGESEAEQLALRGSIGKENGVYPYVRVTGVHLHVEMAYYNYRMAPGDLGDGSRSELHQERFAKNNHEVVCIAYIRPYLGWNSLGYEFDLNEYNADKKTSEWHMDYGYGIQVTFEVSGTTGGFDYFVFITALTQGIVMVGTAAPHFILLPGAPPPIIPSFSILTPLPLWSSREGEALFMSGLTCAEHINMCGRKSQQYQKAIYENYNVMDAYAQFGVQAVVASVVFDILDSNGDGTLSKPELFVWLRNLFSTHMSFEHSARLVEFIMYIATIKGTEHELRGEGGEEGEPEERGSLLPWNRMRSRAASRSSLPVENIVERPKSLLRRYCRLKRRAPKAQITRSEWIEVFTGGLTSFKSCAAIIQRKLDQGHFTIDDSLTSTYMELDSARIAKDLSKTRAKGKAQNGARDAALPTRTVVAEWLRHDADPDPASADQVSISLTPGPTALEVQESDEATSAIIATPPALSQGRSTTIFDDVRELKDFVQHLHSKLGNEREANQTQRAGERAAWEARVEALEKELAEFRVLLKKDGNGEFGDDF
ncbi:hypothetical protein CYMTET_49234 [Cymbomonas tetramitiformis]|uniref:EF-hand domain-containing protein n=1 Tax=Cymbomonas tetramitiformis TaxID=36881 RepID=A0AAE0EUC9_9CHLO|nr:hypothetical protein CYMTET_49234 [Cymbomonas tetramitiformis]